MSDDPFPDVPPIPMEISFRGLDLEQELVMAMLTTCFNDADKQQEAIFRNAQSDGDTVSSSDISDPFNTPFLRYCHALATGAAHPVKALVEDHGIDPHRAIPLVINAMVAEAFLAGIEYQKRLDPKKGEGNAPSP